MKCKVFVTANAHQQIEEDAQWWAENRSEAQARRWYEAIYAELDSL